MNETKSFTGQLLLFALPLACTFSVFCFVLFFNLNVYVYECDYNCDNKFDTSVLHRNTLGASLYCVIFIDASWSE